MRFYYDLSLCLMAVAFVGGGAEPQGITLLLEADEVLTSEPPILVDDLAGREVWVGDATGLVGQSKLKRQSEDSYTIVLSRPLGDGFMLAYTSATSFQSLTNRPIENGPFRDVAARKLRELGAGSDRTIVVRELAMADLDHDGSPEIIADVHTTRDPAQPFRSDPGDLDALMIMSRRSDSPQVEAALVGRLAETKPGRSIPTLLALARDPGTATWDLLIQHEQRFADEMPFKLDMSVNGEQVRQPDGKRTRLALQAAVVYRYMDGSLIASKTLATTESAFCVEPCDESN